MQARVFNEIRRIVYDASGIQIQDGKESMVSARIGQRLKRLPIDNESEYLEYLNAELDKEIVELLDVISTNVTSWWREAEHFKILGREVASWAAAGQRRFRFWCAASSTGEEPYTIAITIKDALDSQQVHADWRLLATDISTRVLAEAESATYSKDRVQGVPPDILARCFEAKGASFTVRPELRSKVLFRRLNLSQRPFPMKGPLDVIFCRNVMIYFDTDMRAELVTHFHKLLKPGGLLISGKSESLANIEGRFERAGPTTYRKVG